MITNISDYPLSVQSLIKHYDLDVLPVEGTLYRQVYKSNQLDLNQRPYGSAMIGLYCHKPQSVSCFHRLKSDEVWHFYGGDPIELYLLYPDGTHEIVILGNDFTNGEKLIQVIPAGTWQAGQTISGGEYSLFGCTMAPAFWGPDFEAAIGSELELQYPELTKIIRKLSVNEDETRMPEDFEG